MIAAVMIGLMLMVKLLPGIPASKSLHHAFVEAPLEMLATWNRKHLIYGVVLVFVAFSGQSLIMMGASDLVMVIAWDISLYVDAVIASWMVAATARSKAAWRYLKAQMSRMFRPARRRAPRRQKITIRRPANDADGEGRSPGFALAA